MKQNTCLLVHLDRLAGAWSAMHCSQGSAALAVAVASCGGASAIGSVKTAAAQTLLY